MKYILAFIILLFSQLITLGQDFPIPKNYSMIDSVSGDLDKDGIKELVIAYNTQEAKEDPWESVPRELLIYKKQNAQWTVWQRSKQALYGSRDGGMMGDPFGEIKIEKGILSINQMGGSSWKWAHTDKYRYQNGAFHLIGYWSTYGKLCEYWSDVDFNLLTGKLTIKKEYEDCENQDQEIYKRENETLYKKGLKITLQNRSTKEVKFVSPKYKHQIYIASKTDD